MLKRKLRSLIKKISLGLTNWWNYIKVMLLEENIKLSKNVNLGKNIILKTTDGGSIVIGDNVSIEANSYIYAQYGTIEINENTFIGYGTQIVAKESITIGKDCLIASYCVIRDNNHNINSNQLINKQGHTIAPIIIGNDVWIGTHCTITKDKTIHNGAVIGANSVVTKDVEEYSVVGGVPTKFIKKRV